MGAARGTLGPTLSGQFSLFVLILCFQKLVISQIAQAMGKLSHIKECMENFTEDPTQY